MTANKSNRTAGSRIAAILPIRAVFALLTFATRQTSTPNQQAPAQATLPQITIE